ncbi:hypothetical protein BC629DRAFT_1515582 [Irpex lacteus]|nr:hypothetical protein BC629DRAFT_1515582 [Irpex lacteus]
MSGILSSPTLNIPHLTVETSPSHSELKVTCRSTGAWVIHPLLIIAGKIVIDTIPGMEQELSWTLFHYLMFHYVTGIPFQSDMHGGAYDDLTIFLASTHYTNYNPWNFAINLSALIFVLIPKLPQLHRQRVRFMVDDEPSGMSTPVTPGFPGRSGSTTPNLLDDSIPPIKITPAHFQ